MAGDARRGHSLRTIAVFHADPDLLHRVPADTVSRLSRLKVPLLELPNGPWAADEAHEIFGYLVLSGVLAHETRVLDERSIELVGAGDVIVPRAEQSVLLPCVDLWEVVQPAQLALLDTQFIQAVAGAPEILTLLVRRVSERADRNLIQLTLARVHPAERRVEMLLWLLAERWGVRREGAVELPLRLTQDKLAALAATERPTMCRVLLELVRSGVLEKLPGKQFRLLGPAPSRS